MWPFKRSPVAVSASEKLPEPGEKWFFTEKDDSPFPPKPVGIGVDILDVKDGWVRYYMGPRFPDERRTIKSFVRMYTPEERSKP